MTGRTASERLIAEIVADGRGTRAGTGRDSFDPRVLDALRRAPREAFIPADAVPFAYANRPLPIGHGQTISQPGIVALMTDMIAPRPGEKVLEIGTGSGWQAAVLAALGARVFSVEVIPELSARAAAALAAQGFPGIRLRVGDGWQGWPEEAPFDAILVTAIGSLPIRAARSFLATRVLSRTHQDVLVFLKGDRKRAAARMSDVDAQASLDSLAGISDEDEF